MQRISHSKYNWGEVSSALQKSVRRGLTDEARYWALEMFLVPGAARTNFWNRMIVFTVEDVSIANPEVIVGVYSLMSQHRDNPTAALKAADLLTAARKSRISDWACHVDPIDRNADQLTVGDQTKVIDDLIEKMEEGDLSASYRHCILCMETKDHLDETVRRMNPLIAKRYKHCSIVLWVAYFKAIEKYPAGKRYLSIMYEIATMPNWRWEHKSQMIHMHVINMFAFKLFDVDYVEKSLENAKVPDCDYAQYQEFYSKHISRDPDHMRGVPDIAVDKHTQAGKALGRHYKHFFQIGCFLVNRDERLRLWEDNMKQQIWDLFKDFVTDKNVDYGLGDNVIVD